MKKLLLVLFLGGLLTQAQAQRRDVTIKDIPQAVSNSFNKAYHSAKSEWKKLGNEFEAAFEDNGTRTYVVYDSNGNLVRKEVDVENAKFPAPAKVYVKKNYGEVEIIHLRKVTDAKGVVTYRGEVKQKELYFDSNGNFVKVVEIKD